MAFDLAPFADAEEVLRIYLRAKLPVGTSVVSATGVTVTPPVVKVQRIGGDNDRITDFPTMLVTCITDSRPESNALAAKAQAAILNAVNDAVLLSDGSTALIDGAVVRVADHPEAYDNPDLRVVNGTYELRLRRPKVPA